MFRLIVYFYDLRHDTARRLRPAQSLAYFFMLPNVCFPLFPVVDYKTFRRNYYDDDAYRIYQVGIDWIVRGVVHLILYRFVYYYVTLAPSEVTSPAELLQYFCRQLPPLPAGLRFVPYGRRHAAPVRIPTCPRRTTATCSLRASPTSGAGSTSTGRTSCRRSSTTRRVRAKRLGTTQALVVWPRCSCSC